MSQQTAHVINYVCFSRDFGGDGKKINTFKKRGNRTNFKDRLGVERCLTDGQDSKICVK